MISRAHLLMRIMPRNTKSFALSYSTFLTGFQTPGASSGNLQASDQLYRVAGQPETPLAGSDLNGVGYGVELSNDRCRSDALEALVSVCGDISAGQLCQRPVAHGAAQYRVDPRRLGDSSTLARCHLSAVARQELSERRFLGKSRVSDPARPIGFSFKVLRPTLSACFRVEWTKLSFAPLVSGPRGYSK
jgi:hypothetical protein